MNRPIKFRAWDKSLERIIPWEDIENSDHNYLKENIESLADTAIIMQFTGLLDKNGKEIYEGDILKEQVGHRSIHWIIWDTEECRFEALFSGYGNQLLKRHIKDIVNFEIIGNIYQDSHLLTTQDK